MRPEEYTALWPEFDLEDEKMERRKNRPVEIDTLCQKPIPLIGEQTTIEMLAGGFRFVEGPVWIENEKRLIFSDIPGNALYSWDEEVGVGLMRPNSYMANGNTLDVYGNLITCEHATSRVTATDLSTGRYTVLASRYQGAELNSPNDVIGRSDGSIYFTDPMPGRQARVGVPRAPGLPFQGIFRYDDKTACLQLLDDSFVTPNGLCFSSDESLLYVNDSADGKIWVFDVNERGLPEHKRHLATVTGDGPGCADGMKYHRKGILFCTGPGGIYLVDTDRSVLCRIRMPEVVANLTFDEAHEVLYVTATSSIYRITL